ncbi:MAG TPA: presqualene diphosphate synthase HpnD [Streptosporangiaceae bacterium]|jgi:phytoene synthase
MSTVAPASPDVLAAYQHCQQVTSTQARNFSYGIALLPRDRRRALSAVYALARRIDDIGDGDLPAADKLAALEQARAQVTELAAGPAAPPADPVLLALADAASRFAIPVAAFAELIDGCEADVRGTTYTTFAELEHYCRCVAGSIGRLSLGVFGSADPAAAGPLADALGVALQLTNILRDIREDLGNGRVYLPAEDLARFGCTLTPGQDPQAGDTGGLERLVRFEAQRARDWYATGLRLMPMLDWRSAASAGAMAGIYLRLLDHISATPAVVLQRRMSLPAKEKIMVAVRSLAGLTPRPAAGGRFASAKVASASDAVTAGGQEPSEEEGPAGSERPVTGGNP